MGNCVCKDRNRQILTRSDLPVHTTVDSEHFRHPIPLRRSEGKEKFFSLDYNGPETGPEQDKYGSTPGYWLAKDIADSLQEVPFYESVLKLPTAHDFALLRNWSLTYAGILKKKVARSKDSPDNLEGDDRWLAVLRDISVGFVQSRMLDVKLGSHSALQALDETGSVSSLSFVGRSQQSVLEMITHTPDHCYTIEGFDSPPLSLSSRGRPERPGLCGMIPTARHRLNIERLPAKEFLRYFVNMNEFDSATGTFFTKKNLLPSEYSEAVLFDVVRQLCQLSKDALEMPVPQSWLGSSLCIACDAAFLPSRKRAIEYLANYRPCGISSSSCDLARVCISDWGASHLTTKDMYEELFHGEKDLLQKSWRQWMRAVLSILYEAVHLYFSQFDHDAEVVTFEVYDYSSYHSRQEVSKHVLPLAYASVPLAATKGQKVLQLRYRNDPDDDYGSCGALTCEIDEVDLPSPSRLQKAWRVHVHGIQHMRDSDVLTDGQPFIVVRIGDELPGNTDLIDHHRAAACAPVLCEKKRHSLKFHHVMYFGLANDEVAGKVLANINDALGSSLEKSIFRLPDTGGRVPRIMQEHFEWFLASVPALRELADTDQCFEAQD